MKVADIYALGILLYDLMGIGQYRFDWPTGVC
jgi:hypothetical protein